MRLTLRTLLAYLDDTLEASEIKEIGDKVAESDAAQELVARLKQVTRRRRLTAPPDDGPEGVDANEVAEYLDNVLAADLVSELEKRALESDVLLAEIAASHQILTLVLGEPAMVPPKAKERMYGLVRGREANPRKKAVVPKLNEKEAVVDEEDLALSSGWLRWILPAAGALLVLLLALAVYQVLPHTQGTKEDPRVAQNGETPTPSEDDSKRDVAKDPPNNKNEEKPVNDPNQGESSAKTPNKKPDEGVVTKPPSDPSTENVERVPPPSKQTAVVGVYAGGMTDVPSVLVGRPQNSNEWKRLNFKDPISTNEVLVALPGFSSILQTQSGVGVLLRGSVRELALNQLTSLLSESSVVLHADPKFDLDLTLLRGRIYLTNRKSKGEAKIRLRFNREAWDLSLTNPGDEVCVDLVRFYTPITNHLKGEEPKTECFLNVVKGDVGVKIDAFHTYNLEVQPPKRALFVWDNYAKARGPFKESGTAPALDKQPINDSILLQLPREQRDLIKRMQTSLKNLELLLSDKKTLRDALKEMHGSTDPVSRVLAIYCLAAIDSIGLVCDSLSDERDSGGVDRDAATYALQRWISRGPEQAKLLYNEKTGTGILIDKMYKRIEAERIVQLLHPFMAEDLDKPETFHFLAVCLRSPKVAIAELGYQNLRNRLSQGKIPPGFNATWSPTQRERYSEDIEKMIDRKQLPPQARKDGNP